MGAGKNWRSRAIVSAAGIMLAVATPARADKAAEIAAAEVRVDGFATVIANAEWRRLSSGLEFLEATIADGNDLLVWRFRQGEFALEIEEQRSPQGSTAAEIQKLADAPLVVDGGYYEIHGNGVLKPAGLLIVDGREVGAFDPHPKAGTGLLYVKDGRIHIGRSKDHASFGDLDHAVQVGPLLVDPGGKNGIRTPGGEHASRAVLCLTADDQVQVLITTGGIYRFDIGALLSRPAAEGGLGCERAINLDGEPSTQAVYVDDDGVAKEVLTEGQSRAARMNNLLVFRRPD